MDAFLIAIIEGSFIRPDVLNVDRMGYDAKIRLCVGSGLVHEEIMPVLRELGKLRNRFAHNLWHSHEKAHEADFIKAIDKFKTMRDPFIEAEFKNKANTIQDAI